ncbi:MAG TPA: hypothetical protein VFJ85_14585 [Acidimicrobiales bacterium]|nr:hypothetical protein [Acidimicrobiales bacterium]
MSDLALFAYVWQMTARAALVHRVARNERGEGVISAAIAVLVMAFLGVLMWQILKGVLTNAGSKADSQVGQVGS